jgi:hypothetical protein
MRKIVLAALFATVSSVTGASFTPAAAFGGRTCSWTASDGTWPVVLVSAPGDARRIRALRESPICGTNCQVPAEQDLRDADHAAMHGLRPRRLVAA